MTAQEHASSRTCPVLQKNDVVLCMPCRKHLLRGSTVLSYCVLPPVHIGQDLVYSGITTCTENYSPKIVLCIGTRDVQMQALYQCRGQEPKCEYIFQKYFLKHVFLYSHSCEYRPHIYLRKKLIPQEVFPACIGFVLGGMSTSAAARVYYPQIHANLVFQACISVSRF